MTASPRLSLLALSLALPFTALGQPVGKAPDTVNIAPFQFQDPAQLAPLSTSCSKTAACPGPGAKSAGTDTLNWAKDVAKTYTDNLTVDDAGDEEAFPYEMQVFISTGMPDGVLQKLFEQALAEEHPQRIRFVVRGFEPQQIGALIFELRKLFPNPSEDELIIEIDPMAFRQHGVEAVPVYHVYEQESDKWFEVRGAISLDGAREHVQRRGQLVVGELYDITEPDILALIRERSRNYDWGSAIERAYAGAAQKMLPRATLPQATASSTTYFDPVFVAPEDISVPPFEGAPAFPLAKKGDTFRVLEHTSLPAPIIVFDATDDRQQRIVAAWLEDHPDADLFVVGVPPVDNRGMPGIHQVAERFRRPVYPWFERMAMRFGVQAVPAIVDQPDDTALRIRYEAPTL